MYTKTEVNKDNLTFIRVTEVVESVIPLSNSTGNGVITHVGAYKRFRFQFNGKKWTTEPGNKHAIADDKSEAICMENIRFSHETLEKGWDKYRSLSSKPYFVEV